VSASSRHLLSAGKPTLPSGAEFGPVTTLVESIRAHTGGFPKRPSLDRGAVILRNGTDNDLVHINMIPPLLLPQQEKSRRGTIVELQPSLAPAPVGQIDLPTPGTSQGRGSLLVSVWSTMP
jgi:hypothetical protein